MHAGGDTFQIGKRQLDFLQRLQKLVLREKAPLLKEQTYAGERQPFRYGDPYARVDDVASNDCLHHLP